MARTRMEWDWVGDYPVFIYTQWLSEKRFNVKIVLGTVGDQNIGNTGPDAPAYMEYTRCGLVSRDEVEEDAFCAVATKLGVSDAST